MKDESNFDMKLVPAGRFTELVDELIARISSENISSDNEGKVASADVPLSTTVGNLTASIEESMQLSRQPALSPGPVDLLAKNSSLLDGLIFSPIIKGILGLFSGGKEGVGVPLPRYQYAEEESTSVAAASNLNGSVVRTNYDSFGVSRNAGNPYAPINITVQALDARSIVERSDDIATAVRQAMLSNSSLNDSIGEI